MKKLAGLQWRQRYNEHMGCIKGCLDYLGVDISFPWLYGGTGQAFVLNMNDTVFVYCAQAWDISALFELGPNLGWRTERIFVDHSVAKELPRDQLLEKQREAWDFVRARIDRGLPCYGWELSHIPSYWVINGYDTGDQDTPAGYYYSGWESGGPCPWDKLGTFDVVCIHVLCVQPCDPASDEKTVKDALAMVLERVERPDGWAIGPKYRTGLAGYEMWANALKTGKAILDGQTYLSQVWLECREMAVEFLVQARQRLPGRCDAAFDDAIDHYTRVRDRLLSLSKMHPEREKPDWHSPLTSLEGAQLVREAGAAERKGVACLRKIVDAI